VRVCPTKTEANRVHLAFSGGRQGFSWSWIKGERAMKSISRTAFAQCQSSISVGSQSRCRATYNLTPMSASGSVTISFSAWNSMITRCTKRIGMILMIVPASRVTEEPPSELWQTIQPSRVGRPRRWAGRVDTTASVTASEQPESNHISSASFVDIVGLLQLRLTCSGRK
jgi:hypothetical protein